MKRVLTEPLVHFVLLGAALFAAASFLAADTTSPNAVVVSAGKIEHLAALFARTWQRPPSRTEMEGLVNDFVREEVAYREGLEYGLDRDDTIIRRRLRQKLEFVAEDLARQLDPSDDDLATYLAEHPDDFRVDPRLSFRQVFLDPERRKETLDSDARELLITLNGDPFAGLFGTEFAATLAEAGPGSWEGPLRSAYGMHLVIVDERSEGRLPELDEVRAQVLREWENVRRIEAVDAFYSTLIEKYEIMIEWPEGS
jgi:hypothetical protein